MGLDVYAGFIEPNTTQSQTTSDNTVVDLADYREESIDYICDNAETPFYWRKHARLQQFMMELNDAQNGIKPYERAQTGMMGSFNGPMFLEREDIVKLQELVENNNLPFCPDSFFWGHQFQEETVQEYKEQDLDFCKKALDWLDKGYRVVYICSW